MSVIKAGDINIEHYVEGSGPPLLMIMGFGGQAISWGEPMLRALTPHFTCIRLSNRGTGLSDKPAEQPTIRTMADDAANLLAALGVEGAHVFGVSMGGMIAQEFTLAHPERVNGLVLGCTAPGGPNTVTSGPEIITMLMPTPGTSREEQIRKAWPAICAPSFIQGSMAFLEAMLAESLVNPTPMDTILKQTVAIQSFNSYDRLGEIKAPTLVIHGDADLLVPHANGKILAERIPGAEFVTLPGAGHMFFWEQPAQAGKAIVEFLSRVPAGA
jgi:pimeloyl-ACP methyl ester carboxylesterase